MVWLTMILVLFGAMVLGVWIAVALGIAGIVIMQIWGGGITLLGSVLWSSLDIYGLTAIPLFILMGEFILRSGISGRMYSALTPLMARLPGKLLQVNIVLSALFSAVFGSSTACAAAVGSISIPEMRKRGYDNRLILGSVCVAGTLALMIPPSSQFILYGAVAQVSIGALFAAGIIPGVMLAIFFMIYLAIQYRVTPNIVPAGEKVLPWGQTLKTLLGLWPLIVLMILCVGPIYAGWTTATEAAGIGAIASLLVGCTVGKLSLKDMWASVRETTRVSSMLFFIMLGAMILSIAFSTLGLPRQLIEWVGHLPISPWIILVLIYIVYIILGCFFDGISMMLMTMPFVSPIVAGMGFDAIWFGVLLVLVIEIALVTPPVGMNLFVVQGVAGKTTSMSDVFWGSLPFLVCCCVALAAITLLPQIATWLPRVMHMY